MTTSIYKVNLKTLFLERGTKTAAIRIDTILAIQNRQNGKINNQIM